MKCPHTEGHMELSRDCGLNKTYLLDVWCDSLRYRNRYGPRLHYNTSSGCCTLTDVGKDDSCVYNVTYYGYRKEVLKSLSVTVLDPPVIRSRWFLALALVLVGLMIVSARIFLYRRKRSESRAKMLMKSRKVEMKKMESRDVEMMNGHLEEHVGPPRSGSEPDSPDVTRELLDPPDVIIELLDPPDVTRELLDPPDVTTELLDPPDVTRELLDPLHQDSHKMNGSGSV